MTSGRVAGPALFALAALLAAVAAVSAWSGVSRLEGGGGSDAAPGAADASDVEAAAAAFVAAYGGFDHGDPHGYVARLGRLAGGALRPAFEGAAVDPAAVAARLESAVAVQSVSVTVLSAASAEATVRSLHRRVQLDGASGERIREVVRQHVRLRLAREGGRWLVTEVLVLSEEPASAWGAG